MSMDPALRNRRIAAMLVVAVIVGVWALGSSGHSVNAQVDRATAASACHDAVKTYLKAPGSARFTDGQVSGTRAGGFVVDGLVDSENGFGAMLRSTFSCTVSVDGDTFTATVSGLSGP